MRPFAAGLAFGDGLDGSEQFRAGLGRHPQPECQHAVVVPRVLEGLPGLRSVDRVVVVVRGVGAAPVAEAAFHHAIAQTGSAATSMSDDTLEEIAVDLVWTVQQSAPIDRDLEESVEAALRSEIRRRPAEYDHPPDVEDAAVEVVLEQAEQYALAA